MAPFKGFAASLGGQETSLPAAFIREALPLIDSLDELKVCLYFFHLTTAQKGSDAYLRLDDLIADVSAQEKQLSPERVAAALHLAVEHKILIEVSYTGHLLYLLNTPRGRAIQRAISNGAWRPEGQAAPALEQAQRPNLFALYEQNIGPLTPILSQTLAEAEKEYPAEWLEDAITTAVKKNVRNWNYVEAILRSWKEQGRHEKDRRDHQENPRDYIEGDLARYIKH